MKSENFIIFSIFQYGVIPMRYGSRAGFSLMEILITLVIIGVIGIFGAKKVLNDNAKYKQSNQSVHHAIMALHNAYQTMKMAGTVTTSTKPKDLTPYLNYVAYDTSTSIDDPPGYTSYPCSATSPCVLLHNGARILFKNYSMAGTGTTNAFTMSIDPDGVYGGSTQGSSKSVVVFVYYDGRIRTWGNIDNPTRAETVDWTPDTSKDPSWFVWQ